MQKRANPKKPVANQTRKNAHKQSQQKRAVATSRALRHTPSKGPKQKVQPKVVAPQRRPFQTQAKAVTIQPTKSRFTPLTPSSHFQSSNRAVSQQKANFITKSQQQARHLHLQNKFAALPTISQSSIFSQFSPSEQQQEAINLFTTASRSISTTNNRKLGQSLTPITLPHHSNLATNEVDTTPFFIPLRSMAMQKAKDTNKKKEVKKGGFNEVDPAEEAFNSAGDVKKNLRNWLEHILQSKPDIHEMPEAAQKNEELFVKECQMRFAQRLDKRSRFEQAKIILKQRAIEQLPNELKDSALKDDPSLWSMRIMTPFSDPPRKRWLHEHYSIPYKASQHEIDDEDFIKKKYARL